MKTTRDFSFLNKKWGKLTLRGWLEVFGVAAALGCIAAIVLVRRDLIAFKPAHSFSVSDPEFFGSAHATADPFPLEGNRITLLHNGDGIFPVMLESIKAAKKTVNFEAFLFHSGKVASQFIAAFCERAKAGVEVRIMLDGVGSGASLNNGDVHMMEAAGCKFAYFHPTHALRIDRINRRTHRRILVVDGRRGFTGGVGFADEWLGNGDSPEHCRDVHAKIEGPLVAKLQGAFQQHWVEATNEILGGPNQFPQLAPPGKMKTQLVASTAFTVASLPLVQAVALSAATKTIRITNPYCTPTKEQVQLLGEAAKRGVNVQLLLPGEHSDVPATKAAGRNSYGELIRNGVKVFEYQPGMIHAKTLVVDGLFSVLGTSNLDARSSQINEEIDVTVYDKDFGAQMDQVFAEDLKKSSPYTLKDFENRSVWDRLSEWLATPFRSQL
ncbi:MAG: cardiolipin synthase [Verrucomicrobiaceae bacterium]|nr:cardiolipin synthase [Verrucomicrobiaceae bacterium]